MKVTAIVGSYRKGGIIDTAVDEIVDSSKKEGADVAKITLIDKHKGGRSLGTTLNWPI